MGTITERESRVGYCIQHTASFLIIAFDRHGLPSCILIERLSRCWVTRPRPVGLLGVSRVSCLAWLNRDTWRPEHLTAAAFLKRKLESTQARQPVNMCASLEDSLFFWIVLPLFLLIRWYFYACENICACLCGGVHMCRWVCVNPHMNVCTVLTEVRR